MNDELIGKWVIVTTEYKGVYFGKLDKFANRQCVLSDARMAIYWGTTHGVDQLANTGPTEKSRLGALAKRVWVCGITSVSVCTRSAAKAWKDAR